MKDLLKGFTEITTGDYSFKTDKEWAVGILALLGLGGYACYKLLNKDKKETSK